ncbi:MAG: PTS sugar transporter subunit IIC, partial [Clostridiales bacterium]
VMGICLTLPISSAALGIILGLSGIAAGAAVAGCAAQMVGFAVISYRENKLGGLFAQGIGTSMLQMPNIIRNPRIWIPAIVASAITGPISSKLLGMTCDSTGCGMGT